MSMPTRNKYVPPSNNVHAPLPFNPYEIGQQKNQPAKPAKPVVMVESNPPQDKKQT